MRRNAKRKDAYLKELEKWKVSFHAGGNFKKKRVKVKVSTLEIERERVKFAEKRKRKNFFFQSESQGASLFEEAFKSNPVIGNTYNI